MSCCCCCRCYRRRRRRRWRCCRVCRASVLSQCVSVRKTRDKRAPSGHNIARVNFPFRHTSLAPSAPSAPCRSPSALLRASESLHGARPPRFRGRRSGRMRDSPSPGCGRLRNRLAGGCAESASPRGAGRAKASGPAGPAQGSPAAGRETLFQVSSRLQSALGRRCLRKSELP